MDDSHVRQMVAAHREAFRLVQKEKYEAMMPPPNRADRRKDKKRDASNARIAKFKAERDELQRRLDAVVAILAPGEKPCRCIDEYGPDENCDWCADRDHYLDSCEWHHRYTLHARAVTIAEGRDNG